MRSRSALVLWTVAALLVGACDAASERSRSERSASNDAAASATPGTTAAPASPTAPAVKPDLLPSEQWYRSMRDGQPTGWRHVRWTRSSYEGRPTVHDHTEGFTAQTRMMGRTADSFEVRDTSDLERTEDGLLLRLESRVVQSGRDSDSLQVWTGKGYDFTSHEAGLEEKHFVACDAPCPVDPEAFLSKKIQDAQVSVGQSFEYKRPNFGAERLETVVLHVAAREKVSFPSGEFDCFRVTESLAGRPGEATWWLDGTGVVRKIRSEGSQTLSTTEKKARDLRDGGAVYSITVDAHPEMQRCTSLDRCVVDVTFAARDGVELPDFPKTPFSSELSRQGNVVRLALTAHDEPAEAIAFPVKDPTFAKALERTNLFCYDADAVKSALDEAVGDETDAREVVRAILRYVFLSLRKASGPIPEPTAVEILEDGGGDCSEHCVLFVTLCRAAGIPARRLSGYAQVGDEWGSHSFAEVWLGRWIGADPTTNEFGTKARYIAFGWDDDPDSFPGLVSTRSAGRMSIHTVEFTEGARTWKTDGLDNPSEREDVLSGLHFAEPPQGWTARVGSTGQGYVTATGFRADLQVIAGFGDLPCNVLVKEMMRGFKCGRFAGIDVLRDDMAVHGHLTIQLVVPFRRRMLTAHIRIDDPKRTEAFLTTFAKVLAPTLQ